MSSKATADFISTEANFSPTSSSSRSKKLPPPPLCLPATTASTEDEKTAAAAQRRERKKSANHCCLPTSSDDCPHLSAPYTLPVSQRPQILKTLIASSSSLLMPPPSENKYKRLYNAAYTNQLNLLKQLQPSSKATVNDNEWIDLMRFIVHKPLEDELKSLLDKYKMTYFDQVNAPNASDETIRSSLCAIVTEALAAYSASSAPPPASSSIATSTSDDTDTNVASPLVATASVNNGSAKRKRKLPGVNPSNSAATALNNQTKFVISYIIPGKHEHHSGNKSVNQQQLKQFQKKCSPLFKYVPDKDEHAFLQREDLVKSSSSSSSASRSPTNRQICLMLHEEVVSSLDEYDLAFSGISLDNSFTLPDSFLARIASMSQ